MGVSVQRLGCGPSKYPMIVCPWARTQVALCEMGRKDTFTDPVFADIKHTAEREASVARINDRPLHDKLAYHEDRSK